MLRLMWCPRLLGLSMPLLSCSRVLNHRLSLIIIRMVFLCDVDAACASDESGIVFSSGSFFSISPSLVLG